MDSEEKDILREWLEVKADLFDLERREKRLKEKVDKILIKKDKFVVGNKIISRYKMSRRTISKMNVPIDIWDKYSKESTYYVVRVKNVK